MKICARNPSSLPNFATNSSKLLLFLDRKWCRCIYIISTMEEEGFHWIKVAFSTLQLCFLLAKTDGRGQTSVRKTQMKNPVREQVRSPYYLCGGSASTASWRRRSFHLSLHCCACARASLPTFRPAGAVSQPLPRPSPSYDRLPSPSVSLTDPTGACVNYYYVLRGTIRTCWFTARRLRRKPLIE